MYTRQLYCESISVRTGHVTPSRQRTTSGGVGLSSGALAKPPILERIQGDIKEVVFDVA